MGGGRAERHRGLGTWELGIGFGLGYWGQWGLDPWKLDRERGEKEQMKGKREKWEFQYWALEVESRRDCSDWN